MKYNRRVIMYHNNEVGIVAEREDSTEYYYDTPAMYILALISDSKRWV